MAEQPKRSKASVNYQLGGRHCGCCEYWSEDEEDEKSETSECLLVAGEIEECFVCDLFKRRDRDAGDSVAGRYMGDSD